MKLSSLQTFLSLWTMDTCGLFETKFQKLKTIITILSVISYEKGHLLITKGKTNRTLSPRERPWRPMETRPRFALAKKQNAQPDVCVFF